MNSVRSDIAMRRTRQFFSATELSLGQQLQAKKVLRNAPMKKLSDPKRQAALKRQLPALMGFIPLTDTSRKAIKNNSLFVLGHSERTERTYDGLEFSDNIFVMEAILSTEKLPGHIGLATWHSVKRMLERNYDLLNSTNDEIKSFLQEAFVEAYWAYRTIQGNNLLVQVGDMTVATSKTGLGNNQKGVLIKTAWKT